MYIKQSAYVSSKKRRHHIQLCVSVGIKIVIVGLAKLRQKELSILQEAISLCLGEKNIFLN